MQLYNNLDDYYPGQSLGSLLQICEENGIYLIEYSMNELSENFQRNFVFQFKTLDDGSLSNGTVVPVHVELVKNGEVLAQLPKPFNYYFVTRIPHFF